MSPVAKHTFAGWVTGPLHHVVTGIYFLISGKSQYALCPNETWMLNKVGKSVMQPMKVSLFAMIEQLQIPHRTVCQAVKFS